MGRLKVGTNKIWFPEEKIISDAINNELAPTGRKYKISSGMITNCVKSYNDNGNKEIDNKYKRGNSLIKYQNSKTLTKEEQSEYENMKLRIENELLKKGKGDVRL